MSLSFCSRPTSNPAYGANRIGSSTNVGEAASRCFDPVELGFKNLVCQDVGEAEQRPDTRAMLASPDPSKTSHISVPQLSPSGCVSELDPSVRQRLDEWKVCNGFNASMYNIDTGASDDQGRELAKMNDPQLTKLGAAQFLDLVYDVHNLDHKNRRFLPFPGKPIQFPLNDPSKVHRLPITFSLNYESLDQGELANCMQGNALRLFFDTKGLCEQSGVDPTSHSKFHIMPLRMSISHAVNHTDIAWNVTLQSADTSSVGIKWDDIVKGKSTVPVGVFGDLGTYIGVKGAPDFNVNKADEMFLMRSILPPRFSGETSEHTGKLMNLSIFGDNPRFNSPEAARWLSIDGTAVKKLALDKYKGVANDKIRNTTEPVPYLMFDIDELDEAMKDPSKMDLVQFIVITYAKQINEAALALPGPPPVMQSKTVVNSQQLKHYLHVPHQAFNNVVDFFVKMYDPDELFVNLSAPLCLKLTPVHGAQGIQSLRRIGQTNKAPVSVMVTVDMIFLVVDGMQTFNEQEYKQLIERLHTEKRYMELTFANRAEAIVSRSEEDDSEEDDHEDQDQDQDQEEHEVKTPVKVAKPLITPNAPFKSQVDYSAVRRQLNPLPRPLFAPAH